MKEEMGLDVRRSRFVWRGYLYPLNFVVFEDRQKLGYFNCDSYQIGLHKKLMYLAKDEVIENILIALESRYLKLKNGQFQALKTEYLSRLFRFQNTHYFSDGYQQFEGRIIGVSNSGLLQIEAFDQVKTYDFKEISFII